MNKRVIRDLCIDTYNIYVEAHPLTNAWCASVDTLIDGTLDSRVRFTVQDDSCDNAISAAKVRAKQKFFDYLYSTVQQSNGEASDGTQSGCCCRSNRRAACLPSAAEFIGGTTCAKVQEHVDVDIAANIVHRDASERKAICDLMAHETNIRWDEVRRVWRFYAPEETGVYVGEHISKDRLREILQERMGDIAEDVLLRRKLNRATPFEITVQLGKLYFKVHVRSIGKHFVLIDPAGDLDPVFGRSIPDMKARMYEMLREKFGEFSNSSRFFRGDRPTLFRWDQDNESWCIQDAKNGTSVGDTDVYAGAHRLDMKLQKQLNDIPENPDVRHSFSVQYKGLSGPWNIYMYGKYVGEAHTREDAIALGVKLSQLPLNELVGPTSNA